MCLKNASDYGVFNGGVYTLLRPFMDGDSTIQVNVDGVETSIPHVRFEGMRDCVEYGEEAVSGFTYSYCATCHKCQGSEYMKVIVIDEYFREDERERWLYTAITRAAESIIMVKR